MTNSKIQLNQKLQISIGHQILGSDKVEINRIIFFGDTYSRKILDSNIKTRCHFRISHSLYLIPLIVWN